MVLIDAGRLEELVREIFLGEDCSPEESARIALYLVRSNLAGHDSHGVIRVPRYVGWLREGATVRGRTLDIVSQAGSLAVADGGYGFGQTVGPLAVELGLSLARQHGVGLVALRHSGHLGRIGEWAEMAVEAGFASVHFVNVSGSLLVAPFGGVDRRFSTAPFAAGFPVAGAEPVILDFATSAVAEGKVLVASWGGKALPEGSLIEPDGRLSADPAAFYDGRSAIRAFGEHKGSGLALMCELLAGALTGSGCAGPGERRFCNGMLSIYMAPAAFGSQAAFDAEVRAYVDFFKSSRPAEPGGEVLLPGEVERRTKAERLAGGVPLPPEAWAAISATAREGGIEAGTYLPQAAR